MDFKKIFLICSIIFVGIILLRQWNHDYGALDIQNTDSIDHHNNQKLQSNNTSSIVSSSDSPQMGKINNNALTNTTLHNHADIDKIIHVKTDTLNVAINLAGGDIVGVKLPKYLAFLPTKYQNSKPFTLLVDNYNCDVSSKKTCMYIAQSALVNTDGPNAKNQRLLYTTNKMSYKMKNNSNSLVVDINTQSGSVYITKQYIFVRNSYVIKVNYIINNKGKTVWKDQFYAQLKRDNSEDPSKATSKAPVHTYLGAAVHSREKTYQKLPFNDFKTNKFNENIKGGYAAILQHYFISAWVPNKNETHTYYTNVSSNNKFYFVGFYNKTLVVQPNQTMTTGAQLYVGPKIQKSLKLLATGLDLTIDYGVLWFLAHPLFVILNWIYSIVGNWGWSIILLTMLVKGVFYPLNATSFRSMAKMRKLSPKIKELKERYGDDRQKMSQGMMELYKKEKVNPMGGCIPIIIQMPVFISLYWVLLESVELRQASWLGWIHDLSQMDPYFILPLLMGVSMFVQQLLNPTPPDPIQAKVMKMMPVIFTFFFLWFPAGLVLYWVTNNILSIIQQYIITKQLNTK